MDFQVKFAINEKIFLRNPESSEVGKLMVKKAIDLIYELGFEHYREFDPYLDEFIAAMHGVGHLREVTLIGLISVYDDFLSKIF
jgi:hypothetical protein